MNRNDSSELLTIFITCFIRTWAAAVAATEVHAVLIFDSTLINSIIDGVVVEIEKLLNFLINFQLIVDANVFLF